MARDSFFGETILWSEAPARLRTPRRYRLVSAILFTLATIAILYAFGVRLALGIAPGRLFFFSAFAVTAGLVGWQLPKVWLSKVTYALTESRVIIRRGPFRRSIARADISYALIRWKRDDPTIGDLVLVRAVPTGALRRTLRLALSEVAAPDRVWALVRNVPPSAALGTSARALSQRLDDDEEVLWTGTPLAAWWTPRRVVSAALAVVVLALAVRAAWSGQAVLHKVGRYKLLSPSALPFLYAAAAVGVLFVLVSGAFLFYEAVVLPKRQLPQTRYFVTNRRVLIRRGLEELSLDRARISYVIDAPRRSSGELHDVFLVLDGPKARGLSASGAFDENGLGELAPVFSAIADGPAVEKLLRQVA